jgi:hypothetical protein
MATVKMTVGDWIQVRDNPRQRNTERHLAKAKHLMKPHPTHAFVAAAKLPDGTLIKLDGHTRALAWERRMVDRPAHVEVTVIPVKSVEEAKELYTHYDSKNALETATDRISGGFNEIGFEPKSALLRSGRIGSALRVAWIAAHGWAKDSAARDTYQMVNEFAAEILALDDMELGKSAASSGIIAAFVLSYRKYGDECLPFWHAVFGNGGVKANGQMDAVQALSELLLQRKGLHGQSAAMDICARALHAYEKYRNSEMLSMVPRPLDLQSYIARKPVKKVVSLRAAE